MKYLLALSLLLVGLGGCHKDDPVAGGPDCDVSDPINNLAWLKAKIQGTGHLQVVKESYGTTMGFLINYGTAASSTQMTGSAFYTCTGTQLYFAEYGGIVGQISNFPADFDKKAKVVQVIYTR